MKRILFKGDLNFPHWMGKIPTILYSLAGLLMIIALARPRFGVDHQIRRADGIDIMLALDVSGSMEAIDLPNATELGEKKLLKILEDEETNNRLEMAKLELKRFVEMRPNDRIGLTIFAENTYTVCPPTLDHDFLVANLKNLKIGMNGAVSTRFAPPIAAGTRRLKDSKAKRKILVLFTDGENTAPASITPEEAAEAAKEFDIKVYTVGIGSPYAFRKVQNFWSSRWRQVEGFDPSMLKKISEITGGQYYAAEGEESFKDVMDGINQLETTNWEENSYTDWNEYFPYLLLTALVIILCGRILETGPILKVP
ncbi:MAG: VWA domain-containing protein [Lentisphaeria bacterium]|nr:VWA domain-containing protein [Lentisphaeria bacterium]